METHPYDDRTELERQLESMGVVIAPDDYRPVDTIAKSFGIVCGAIESARRASEQNQVIE